jgi:D-alanine-D-alanine ligase
MKKIALLSGWPGYEKEVAKRSAQFFKTNLEEPFDYYELPEQLDEFIQNKDSYELAIPVFHGEYGEDGKIFGFLEVLWIPYTFSPFDVHSLCMNKFRTNAILSLIWIQVASQYLFDGDTEKYKDFPYIVKPNHGGSSFYTHKVQNRQELEKAVQDIKNHTTDEILIQQFITWEEYSVPLVNGETLPIMKVEKKESGAVFDYTSKYEDESSMKETFPNIEAWLKERLENSSKRIFDFLWCRWVARIDYIVQDDIPYFLEVNTIPGMTAVSILPRAWNLTGKTNQQLIKEIIK